MVSMKCIRVIQSDAEVAVKIGRNVYLSTSNSSQDLLSGPKLGSDSLSFLKSVSTGKKKVSETHL